jgi:D-arginine dehydrogenase
VTAGETTVSAGVVVNAAGAWADVVAERAGVLPVGLVPHRRTAFVFLAPFDTHGLPMVVDVDQQFYFKPEAGRFMGSLAEETPMEPHDVRAEEIDVALAIDRINTATTLEIRHVSRSPRGSLSEEKSPLRSSQRESMHRRSPRDGFGINRIAAPGHAHS